MFSLYSTDIFIQEDRKRPSKKIENESDIRSVAVLDYKEFKILTSMIIVKSKTL